MKVSKQFLRDFAYLANFYGWTPADIEDVKAQTRVSVELRDYWTTLADAHRAGYQQTENNGYMRLAAWRARQVEADEGLGSGAFSPTSPAREAQASSQFHRV